MSAEETIQTIMQLFRDYGERDYIGENVTQLDHMIQTAMCAERDGADDQTIVAAFLHAIGHLLGLQQQHDQMDDYGTANHDQIGADYLRQHNFPYKVCKLVENHVLAKRYMITLDPTYYNLLSNASKKTLEYQGGRMSDDEMYEFDTDPYKQIYIQFRTWEDSSKKMYAELQPLEKYEKLMRKILFSIY